MQTNIMVGQYPGWRAREYGATKNKALPTQPMSMMLNKLSDTEFKHRSSTKLTSSKLPKEAPTSASTGL